MGSNVTLTQQQFIERVIAKHGNVFSYEHTHYTGAHNPVTLTCLIHGPFSKKRALQVVTGSGCSSCGRQHLTKSTEHFVTQARVVHGDSYDYACTKYHRTGSKVEIVCPIHGHFHQIAELHLRGHGCQQCANQERTTPGLYCKSYFEQHPTVTGFFYVVRFYDKNESFVKIGITKQSNIALRYASQRIYKYELLVFTPMLLSNAYNCEQNMIKNFSEFKYIPEKSFAGHTETFSEQILEKLDVR